MGKKDDIEQLTNLMTKALRHKIGSIVNEDELYAAKYAKDSETIMKEAEKAAGKQNWNRYDKDTIKEKLLIKLKKELAEKEFLDNRKFDVMDDEVKKALANLDLV